MPEGNGEAVVIDNAGAAGLMVIENDLEAVTAALSVTVTLKLNVPAALGVPLSTPADDRFSPAGALPDQLVYGGVPPVAANVTEE